MTISETTPFRRVDLPGSRIDDEMVFFDQTSGRYFATGPVGADIWDFLASERTFAEICTHLLNLYDIDQASCEAETRAFLTQMLEAGLVTGEAG